MYQTFDLLYKDILDGQGHLDGRPHGQQNSYDPRQDGVPGEHEKHWRKGLTHLL
jgi:hypothetical protein